MAGKSSKAKEIYLPIILAVLSLAGVMAAALFSNWDKIFLASPSNADSIAAQKVTTPVPKKTVTPEVEEVQAEEPFDYWTRDTTGSVVTTAVFRHKFDNLEECQKMQEQENAKILLKPDRCEDETPDLDRLRESCVAGDALTCKMKDVLEQANP